MGSHEKPVVLCERYYSDQHPTPPTQHLIFRPALDRLPSSAIIVLVDLAKNHNPAGDRHSTHEAPA